MNKGLMITRRAGESFIVRTSDGDIEVSVAEIRTKSQVKFRVTAPDNVTINRKEVQEKKDSHS